MSPTITKSASMPTPGLPADGSRPARPSCWPPTRALKTSTSLRCLSSRLAGQLPPRSYSALTENRFEMMADGAFAQAEPAGDLAILQPQHYEAANFVF